MGLIGSHEFNVITEPDIKTKIPVEFHIDEKALKNISFFFLINNIALTMSVCSESAVKGVATGRCVGGGCATPPIVF